MPAIIIILDRQLACAHLQRDLSAGCRRMDEAIVDIRGAARDTVVHHRGRRQPRSPRIIHSCTARWLLLLWLLLLARHAHALDDDAAPVPVIGALSRGRHRVL